MVKRHPSLAPAIAFALGIIFASLLPLECRAGFAAALACAIAAAFWKKWLCFPAWFLLGASLLSFRMELRSPTDLRHLFTDEPELVTIRGVLQGDPEHRVLEQDRRVRYRTTARLTVYEIEKRGQWQPAAGSIAISTTGFIDESFISGSKAQIAGVLSAPQGPIAPGLFDFQRYLKWQRIHFVLRAETNDWQLLQQPTGLTAAALYRTFNTWARQTLQRGIPADQNTRLLWAMTLGWRQGLNNDVSEPFMRTGTLHVFAISGLHIALMAWMLVKFFSLLGLSRNAAGLAVIPIIWFYAAATGWQASAIRSTIMSSVIILGWVLKRPNNLLNSLAVSAILILLWQPEQLFQPGFQLSFLLLLAIAVWPAMNPNSPWPDPAIHLGQKSQDAFERKIHITAWSRWLARLYQWVTGRDPLLPEDLRPLRRRCMDRPIAWLLSGLNLSLASLICSLPVLALYFNLISFSSLVANLIVVPLSGIALGASMASLATGWLPILPEIANKIAWHTMKSMVAICEWLESFHWTFAYVQSPSFLVVTIYFIALACLLKGWLRKWQVALTLGLATLLAASHALWKENSTTTLTVLPGSGVIFVDAPWNKNDLLIDCGREREAMSLIKPFLHSRGIDRLPAILLTHGDVEHVDGYPRLAQEFNVQTTFTSHANSRSPKYRSIIQSLEGSRRWKQIVHGDAVQGWEVLHPAPGEDFGRADDEAVVLSKTINNIRIILLSDLGRNGQRALAERADLKCDLLIFGSSAAREFHPPMLEEMAAQFTIQTGPELHRAATSSVPNFRTSAAGAFTLRAHASSATLEATKIGILHAF